jgi:hypothetical protein
MGLSNRGQGLVELILRGLLDLEREVGGSIDRHARPASHLETLKGVVGDLLARPTR